jgi:putrescine transport system permease protein
VRDFIAGLDLQNYGYVLGDSIILESLWQSVAIAAGATLIMLLIGYPIAHAMARAPSRIRPLLLIAIILPFWTSFLIRIYAWIGILAREGFLNQALLASGLIDAPLELLSTNKAVVLGIVYSYLPFMVLPLYATLERMDETLLEAAADLGAPPWKAFWLVTFPLSFPGIVAGSLLCFIPAVGEFVIPDLLGGSETLMLGKTIWTEFAVNRSWTVASAAAVLMLVVLVGPILVYQHLQTRSFERGR